MWTIHAVMALVAIIALLLGYWMPLPDDEGSGGFLLAFFRKTGMLLGGLFGLWYGMYMLGWRLVQVAS